MNESIDFFKKTIEEFLNKKAETDIPFYERMKLETKNIDDCIKYIITSVKKTGRIGFDDKEIYNLAIHYYDEDIDASELSNVSGVHVVSNHEYVLTEEEKEKQRLIAIQNYNSKVVSEYTTKSTTKKQTKEVSQTLSLFGDETED